jgi:hypothetical protein
LGGPVQYELEFMQAQGRVSYMAAWISKWAPASGTLTGVLVAIAFFASLHSPGDSATGAQVSTWYGSHHTADFAFDLIEGLAVLSLVLFAVALARQVGTGDRWSAYGHWLGPSSATSASFVTPVDTGVWLR